MIRTTDLSARVQPHRWSPPREKAPASARRPSAPAPELPRTHQQATAAGGAPASAGAWLAQHSRPVMAVMVGVTALPFAAQVAHAASPVATPEVELEPVAPVDLPKTKASTPKADLFVQVTRAVLGGASQGFVANARPSGHVRISAGGDHYDWLHIDADNVTKSFADNFAKDTARLTELAKLGYEGVSLNAPGDRGWVISLAQLRSAGVETKPEYPVDRSHKARNGLFNVIGEKLGYWSTDDAAKKQRFEDRALRAFEVELRGTQIKLMDYWHVNEERYGKALLEDSSLLGTLAEVGVKSVHVEGGMVYSRTPN